jgi:transcriptional regulator with XRE-family HTH domain
LEIGDKIKALRLKRPNYSQIKLAKDTGLTPAAISQYENNVRKPNLDALQKIANALQVSTDYLLGEDDLKNDVVKTKILFRRVNELSDESKKQLEDYIKFLESKEGKN